MSFGSLRMLKSPKLTQCYPFASVHSMDRTDKYYVYTIKSNKSLRRKDFCKFCNKNSVSNYLKFEIGKKHYYGTRVSTLPVLL